MKVKLFAFLLIAAGVAPAAPITCSSGGWKVSTASNFQSATVTLNGQAVPLGSLNCTTLAVGAVPMFLSLSCKTSQAVAHQSGYHAYIKMSPEGTEGTGVLSTSSDGDRIALANLHCLSGDDQADESANLVSLVEDTHTMEYSQRRLYLLERANKLATLANEKHDLTELSYVQAVERQLVALPDYIGPGSGHSPVVLQATLNSLERTLNSIEDVLSKQ